MINYVEKNQLAISFRTFSSSKNLMPATRTYSPLTPQNPAESLQTNTCRSAGHAAIHPVQPLKGLPGTRATDVSYRASVPAGHAGRGVALSYRALAPSGAGFCYRICTGTSESRLTANFSLLTANSSYTFSAKEKDSETGLSYFGSRNYSSDLSVWLSVDPMSDKYPSLSPYVYCADNPVKLVDPNGEYLEVADNDDTHNDLLSIVGKTHRDRVIFNKDGSVSVNMEGLSQEAIDKDIGLSLINDMVNSDYKYYFETSDDAFLCNQSGKRTCERIATEKFRGVVNASVYGLDYFGEHRYLPMEGFEGQVVIAKSGQFTLYEENVRKNVVFHELEENFLRTDKRMDYQGGYGVGAHRTAARIENNAWGNFAGQGDYTPPQTPQSKSNDSIMNYINYGIYK